MAGLPRLTKYAPVLRKHCAYAVYPFAHQGKRYLALDRANTTLVLQDLGNRQIKIRSPSVRQEIGEKLAREGRITRRLDFGNA